MKTVLAPNAPWPSKPVEKLKPTPKPKVKKERSKIAHTDKKFDEWATKNGVKK